MNDAVPKDAVLNAMFVDDDKEIIEQCRQLVPESIGEYPVRWTMFDSFEEAVKMMDEKKYDIVVTDVYKGRALSGKLNVNEVDNRAASVVERAKELGFSFIVMYSDGACPTDIGLSPSLQFVDKALPSPPFPQSIAAVLGDMLEKRGAILQVMTRLRRELESDAAGYIWGFLEANWDALSADADFATSGLERLIRRRASIQINELIGAQGMTRRPNADAYDYYVMPVLPGDLRLGTLLSKKNKEGALEYFIVLTPHCHMARQGEKPPRADTILLAECIPSKALTSKGLRELEGKKTRIPASSVGTPDGRYCFLPEFCGVPDLYIDLMRLTSVALQVVESDYERMALVDSPFAEAVQSSMARFYANVGHRNLIDHTVK